MFASALGREAADRAFKNLQEGLLHAFAGDVARDGHVFRLGGDLVDLVDVDDAALGAFHVAIGVLPQIAHDVLHVLAHVAGLGERGCVADGEGHLQHLGERLREERFAAARRPDEQNVGLFDLDIRKLVGGGRGGIPRLQATIVVVDGDGERLLRLVVADHILVQKRLDLLRRGHRPQGWRRGCLLRRLLGRFGLRSEDVVHERCDLTGAILADARAVRAGDDDRLAFVAAAERTD